MEIAIRMLHEMAQAQLRMEFNITVPQRVLHPVMLPMLSTMICHVSREGKSLLCEAEQLEAVFCGA